MGILYINHTTIKIMNEKMDMEEWRSVDGRGRPEGLAWVAGSTAHQRRPKTEDELRRGRRGQGLHVSCWATSVYPVGIGETLDRRMDTGGKKTTSSVLKDHVPSPFLKQPQLRECRSLWEPELGPDANWQVTGRQPACGLCTGHPVLCRSLSQSSEHGSQNAQGLWELGLFGLTVGTPLSICPGTCPHKQLGAPGQSRPSRQHQISMPGVSPLHPAFPPLPRRQLP